MPITVGGTQITFNDATTQTTAGLTGASAQLAKAWVNFDGIAATIRASYNISSITKAGTGSYTANFTNALADANYCTVAGLSPGSSLNPGAVLLKGDGGGPYSTTQVSVGTWGNANTSLYDTDLVTLAVFN
jgi:hypothetical protein